MRRHAAVFLMFVVLAMLMTWPLVRNMSSAVAYPGDPYLNTWILDWDWYATFHDPVSLFDANIFYPARSSLAFSENLYGIAILLFPFRALGVTPIAAHNLAILGGFALSGFGAYLLGFLITGSAMAAAVGGIFYAFVPFRFTHLSHVQHVWGGTLPLMLAALLWYVGKPTWGRAALFAAAFLFNGLCNIHWLLFGSLAIAATFLIERPPIRRLGICTFVAAILLLLFLHPYFEAERLYGMRRSWSETMNFSATPADWLVSNFHNRLYTPLRNPAVNPERWLFPGVLSLLIGSAAFATRKWRPILDAGIWVIIGFLGSLGLHTFFHRFLFSHVPGFAAIRVPARWASIAYVGLAMLVAMGAAKIAHRGLWVSGLLLIALLMELRSAPIRWYMAVPEVPAVEQWIADSNADAVAELPMEPNREYSAMLRATVHHRPMVNGISGFAPPQYLRIAELARSGSDALVPELQRIGVSHLIVHADGFDRRARAWLSRAVEAGELGFVRRFDGGIDGDWLFSIGQPGSASSQLVAMLRGEPTFNEGAFGILDTPRAGEVMTHRAWVSGFALSPYGVRQVNVLVNNGTMRLPTQLRADPALHRLFPWYDASTRPRFVAAFSKRPAGVWKITDIQAEIIDGRGERTLLDDRWITWP